MSDCEVAILDDCLSRLARPLAVDQRFAILMQVAEYWHGPMRPLEGFTQEELRNNELPIPLRWWYTWAGRRTDTVFRNNHLYRPDMLEPIEDGRVVFFYENQGVYIWATRSEGDDPPVWGKFQEEGLPWTEEGMRLSEFLNQACLLEGLWQAPFGAAAAWADGKTLARVTARLALLPLPPWHWPAYPACLHYGHGAFVFSCPNGECQGRLGFSIWVGGKCQEHLSFMKEIIDDGWEYVAC